MIRQVFIFIAIFLFFSPCAKAQSFSCSPEHVSIAEHDKSKISVEKTTVNWKSIQYHIMGKKAVSIIYKDSNNIGTKLNPGQREDTQVIENTSEKIILMKTTSNPASITMDIIYPKTNSGYSFYTSGYMAAFSPKNKNLAKLYVLKCQNISKATTNK